MLTPIEIHNREHKSGRGYSKKEMDEFLDEVLENYEVLYKDNIELKEKLAKLSEGIQYYKSMETTLQKALVLAEKTANDTIDSANSKAEIIEKEAILKADQVVNKSYTKYEQIKQQCISLIQQYDQFKIQFKQIALKQIELLESDFYKIYSNELKNKLNESIGCISSSLQQETQNENEANITKPAEVISDEDTKEIKLPVNEHNEQLVDNNNLENNETSNENDEKQSDEKIDNLLKNLKDNLARNVNVNDSDKTTFEFLDDEE